MHLHAWDHRIDRTVIGARVSARRPCDVARMAEIAADLGLLVVDDVEASPGR